MRPLFRVVVWGWSILGYQLSQAQPSPLPLEVGNYWIFDTVWGDNRSASSGRLEVHDKVRVRSVSADTFWSNPSEAFGDSGNEYYRLSITGNVRLFPISQPDTLLVRADQQGNIWSRGYVLNNVIRVTAEEQPWLLTVGTVIWEFKLDEDEFAIAYHRDEQWNGQDVEGGEKIVALAQSFIPDLSANSPNKLIVIEGRNNGSVSTSLGGTGTLILTGVGPMWIGLPTDMIELQGIHLELSEAKLGNRLIRPLDATIIQPMRWGQLKTSFR